MRACAISARQPETHAMLEALFWTCAFLVCYHYLLYPALVIAFARLKPAPAPVDPPIWPSVSFVIAAYNEERVIEWKLRNTLALDYPRELFEVIVASDGSNDRTAEIARSFE